MTPNSHPKGVLNANYSDNRAKKKELFFRYRVRANAVIDAFLKHSIIKDSIRLLDLGAADGKTLAFMAAELPIADAVGVEYNQNLIDSAGDLISAENKTSLVRGDVTDLVGINSASFDLVSALALL